MEYEKIYSNQKKNNNSEITIIFNGEYFSIGRYSPNIDFYNENEYLPGIHIKIDEKYPSGKVDEIRDELWHRGNLFYKVSLLFKLFWWETKIERKQEIRILLKVNNKRDNITILDGESVIFENKKQHQDPLNEKFKKINNKFNPEMGYVEFKDVATSKIMYPFQSGGWGNRCIMKQIFGDLGLFHTYYDKYKFFEENEMHYTVSQIEYLKDICSSKGMCAGLLEKFKTGNYVVSEEDQWHDEICLEENNGVYDIVNANHRVCCARMFEIPFVKARVSAASIYQTKDNLYNDDKLNVYNRHLNNRDPKKLTRNYYDILYKIGLNKDEAYEILEKGLRGKSFIDYIENSTGKNILDLYEEVNRIN